MKKIAITRKPVIAISSKQGRRTGGSDAAGRAAAPDRRFNQKGSPCCRFAAGAAIGSNRYNS